MFGTAAQSPSAETSGESTDPEGLVDHDAPALVERQLERREIRARSHSGRPDEGASRDPRAVREDSLVLVERRERGRHADLDPAALELPMRVLAELARNVREDRRCCVHEHPALPDVPQGRVRAPDRVVREVVELRERLDAGVACADEHEAEIALGLGRVEARRGRLERAQEPVAERDRVRDVLEPTTVLGEAGHGKGAWHGAERDHEPFVADLERATESLRDDGLPRWVA